jgi:hypothetical protein
MTETIRAKRYQVRPVLGSAARTTNGQSDQFVTRGTTATFAVHVSLASGTTPTLDMEIEYSVDGTNWFSATTAQTFTQMTTTATWQDKTVTLAGPLWRFNYTIGGGSPSFTFEVWVIAD